MHEPSLDTPSKGPSTLPSLSQTVGFWLSIFLIIFLIILLIHRSSTAPKKNDGPKAPVMIATVKVQDVPIYLDALGSVTPMQSVTIMTQINGILTRVLFREGQMVKKGELLAEIDNRPYLAQLIQFEGQLARDQAALVNAKIDLKRYQTLWKQDSVSEQTLATQKALVEQLEGTVKLDQGQLEVTKVNLIYCKIISPTDGRIGLRLVDPGNYVQSSNTTGIAVVNILNPITVIFSIPEDDIPEVMARSYAGENLLTEAYDRQQNQLLAKGKVLTVDNQIDSSTGTVKIKAEFQNDKNVLFPNQFVNVRLLVKTLKNVMTVPTAAIQNSVNNKFVYVLNPETKTVKVRPVVIGITMNDTTTITKGVKPHEIVITAGTDKLTDGAKVTLAKKALSSTRTHAKHAQDRA